jgi:hypothetical protein
MPRKKKTEKSKTGKKQQSTAVVPVIDSGVDEFAEFLLPEDLSTIESRIEEQFPEQLLAVIKKIAHEIAEVGLSEAEACMISDYPHETFLRLKERYPMIQELISVKDLQYKRSLLKPLSHKATNEGDDKMAQWLLMAKYNDEFNPRKGTGSGAPADDNLIAAGIEFVRKHGDNDSLVTEESGRAFLIKKASTTDDAVKDVKDLLT